MRKINREKGYIRPVILACVLVVFSGLSFAETQVAENGNAAAEGLVVVENIAGSIKVIGWDKKEVKVEGTLSDEVEGLDFKATGKKTTIKVKYPHNIRNINSGADLVIYVPKKSHLDIESISCSIGIEKVKGSASVEVISGDVTLVGDCDEIEINCISGDISVKGNSKDLEIESISGKIEAEGKRAAVSVSSITGEIVLTFGVFLELEVETVDSVVLVDGALAKGGTMELESVSGNVTLVVPENISAEFSIETFSGTIAEAFGHKANKVSQYAPGKELEFVAGKGDGRVKISTFSGNVKIKN